MKRRRFLAVVAIGIVLIFMTWMVSDPTPQRPPAPTNGPLALFVAGRISTTNELTPDQYEGLTRRFATIAPSGLLEFTNALMIQITNRGPQMVELLGYDSASPMYSIYVEGTNGFERLENTTAERMLARRYLGPTQSVSFPVIPPATDRPWRVEVSYNDYFAPTTTSLRKAPKAFENLVGRIRAFVPFLRRPEPRFYYTMSESIVAPERAKAGESHFIDETNRQPSSAESRR